MNENDLNILTSSDEASDSEKNDLHVTRRSYITVPMITNVIQIQVDDEETGKDEDDNVSDLFQCCICKGKVRDAHLCPRCSTLFCYTCLNSWLMVVCHECPSCRVSLHLGEFVKCPWAEKVARKIDTLQVVGTCNSHHEDSIRERCNIHLEELSIYCSTCELAICHLCHDPTYQCALLCGNHVGHTFVPLEEAYELQVSEIRTDVGQLKDRLVKRKKIGQEMERNVESARATKDALVCEMRKALELKIAKLESQFEARLLILMDQKDYYTEETEQLEVLVQKIEHNLLTCTQAERFATTSCLYKLLRKSQRFISEPVPTDSYRKVLAEFDDISVEPLQQPCRRCMALKCLIFELKKQIAEERILAARLQKKFLAREEINLNHGSDSEGETETITEDETLKNAL